MRKGMLLGVVLMIVSLFLLGGCSSSVSIGGDDIDAVYPNTTMTGVAGGEAISMSYAYVDYWGETYDWVFAAGMPEYPCGVVWDGASVNLTAPTLEEGTYTKALGEEAGSVYDAYYYDVDGWSVWPDDWAVTLTVDEFTPLPENALNWKMGEVEGTATFEFSDGATFSGPFTADYCDYT